MKAILSAVAVLASLYAVDASAQNANLTGRWQCRALCLGPIGSYAFITQNGWDLNVLNDVGEPSRAWIDYPGHIWVDRSGQGAIFSPDGFTLQFDRGAIWQRVPDGLLPGMAVRARLIYLPVLR
ncbi:MAG TPA: hypothetical protein VGH13_11740 [Xanthobacteraceae bacterium]|jgi:hypothetical protein